MPVQTRWSAYAGISAALAGGVVVKALAQRPNFYSAAVYLSQSSANLMILTNFIFVAACTLLLGLQKLLYGPLRPIEIEQLYEKAWFAVTETCLAMTIFRGEIGAWFLIMFFALLAGKVWAWIGEGRVEILEQQPPRNPRLFHTRLALSLCLSVFFDMTMLEYVVKQVMDMARPDMMVMFGFEFAVLSIVSLSTASRYAINLIEIIIVRKQKARRIEEIRRERITAAVREAEESIEQEAEQRISGASTGDTTPTPATVPLRAVEAARRALQEPIDEQEIEVEGWDGKGRWIFYLDLTTDFFKLVVYLSFFFILLIFYGLPIHILRDVFMTFRSFFKRIGDFMRYRTATRDMNARYPDATEHDIGSEDVCIICREEMRPYHPPAVGERANPVTERMRPKKLPCGHILHFSCLRSWLERQQICPTCRTNVVSRSSPRTGQNNAGNAEGAAGQHGNAAPAERQGARIYQWGPLRIGIGAARGNMLEDLQQQLGDGQQQRGPQLPGDGPQQYGFGIRWDGLRRRDRADRGAQGIQRQLDDVQRQISREYRALGQMTNELRLLRNMEAELTRIRAQRQGEPSTVPTASQQGSAVAPTVTALTGNTQNVLQAGSGQLPAGVVLPEGWTLMPLHPTQPGPPPLIGQTLPNVPGQIPFGLPHMFPPQGLHQHNGMPVGLQEQLQAQSAQLLNGSSNLGLNNTPPSQPSIHQQDPQNISWNTTSNAGPTYQQSTRTSGNQPQDQSAAQANTDAASALRPTTQNVTLDSRSESSTGHPQSNGTTPRDDEQSADSAAIASTDAEEPTVASMFSLPAWGSTPMVPSSSSRGRNENDTNREHEQPNGGSSVNTGHPSQEQTDGSAASASKRKNPTVEDLVEDPD